MNTKHTYFVVEPGFEQLLNAGILRKDHETILSTLGFNAIQLEEGTATSIRNKFSRLFQWIRILIGLPKSSLVVFQFPIHALLNKWLLKGLSWRGITTLALIIDIDGLRDNDPELLQKEIKMLGQFSILVAHNEAMKKYLATRLPGSRIISIQLFDYPARQFPHERKLAASVVIAANFMKGHYFYQLYPFASVNFQLYGQGYQPDKQSKATNVFYKGFFAPGDLPAIMEGSFGLIWDGDLTTSGNEYLRYNNPHKLSLYLAAGLPVIAWRQSAIADWVNQEQIGLLVENLGEISEKIAQLSERHYQQMQQNAAKWGELVRSGHFLKAIMAKIHTTNLNE